MKKISQTVLSYIKETWPKTTRMKPTKGGLQLPYPVTAPCADERFTCFFYWDTCFANLGLMREDLKQARNNINNMKYFIERMGYIPNGNQECMFNRSQPPLYSHAVMDLYLFTRDKSLVGENYGSIKKEYNFWMKRRITEIGLNQYRGEPNECDVLSLNAELQNRKFTDTQNAYYKSIEGNYEKMVHYYAEAESGWDFSARYGGKALHFVQSDLNAIIYRTEKILEEFATILGKTDEAGFFADAAAKRKERMDNYLRDENGIYHDYDFVSRKQSDIVNAASLVPFAVGLSNDATACKATLDKLEFTYGVSVGDESTGGSGFQWSFPNIWPPLTYWAYIALKKVGLSEDAMRIRDKYLDVVERNFAETNNIYEKYDAVTGGISNYEYPSPVMMGWSAAVYEYFLEEKNRC